MHGTYLGSRCWVLCIVGLQSDISGRVTGHRCIAERSGCWLKVGCGLCGGNEVPPSVTALLRFLRLDQWNDDWL